MEQLLLDADIVRSIGDHLGCIDRVNFSGTSKFVQKVTYENDLQYYIERLKPLYIRYEEPPRGEDLLGDDATEAGNEIGIDELDLMLKEKRTYDPKRLVLGLSKFLAVYIRRLLKEEECDKRDADEEDDFSWIFGPVFIELTEQATILNRLKKYVQIDTADLDLNSEMKRKLLQLTKRFTKQKFDELQKSFDDGNYPRVHDLVGTLDSLDMEDLIVEYFQQENSLPADFLPDTILDSAGNLVEESWNEVINDSISFFNEKAVIIDQCFGEQLPIMLLFTEKTLQFDLFEKFISVQCEENIEIVPQVYSTLMGTFIDGLAECKNAGKNFKIHVKTFINLYMEPLIFKFLEQDLTIFEDESIVEIKNFEKDLENQEKINKDNIYKSVMGDQYNNEQVKSNKFELLTSFTKIFNKSNNNNNNAELNELNFKAKLQLVTKNLNDLKNFINFELCYKIIENAKNRIEIIRNFNKIEDSIVDQVKINHQIEEIFIKLVKIITNYHLKFGFEKSLELLNNYDPTEFNNLESIDALTTVEPLVKFTELINVGDLIQQMIEIFYNNELVARKIVDKNEFLNTSNQTKKKFEAVLDSFVAEGLNVGINKLISEVEFLFNTLQLPNDFNTDPNDISSTGPTKCAVKVVEMLSNHINLLNGSTEQGVIDVFQQEIGERFFQLIVSNIKKRNISTSGAIILISDLNLYYDFVVNLLKQKNITPYFVSLKEIGQLYLISRKDSKEIGKLIGDLSRFNGIFTQEEIYEFVQRRSDWPKVKKDVEKAMYGLGVGDCIIV